MTALLPRILLVEPQFVLRRTIVMVARDLGMVDFHEASSVGRARTLLAAQTYDGLVLDLHEEQQALELLGELRLGRFATARDARVVVLAADAKPDAARACRPWGLPACSTNRCASAICSTCSWLHRLVEQGWGALHRRLRKHPGAAGHRCCPRPRLGAAPQGHVCMKCYYLIAICALPIRARGVFGTKPITDWLRQSLRACRSGPAALFRCRPAAG
jgi:hypothetical protein